MSLLLALVLLWPPQRPGVPELLEGVVQRYSRMTDFSAEFVQTTKDSSNRTRTYRGLLYLKSGRKTLLQLGPPDEEAWYSNGKTVTHYKPRIKQADQGPIGKAEDERLQLFQIPWRREWQDQFAERGETQDTPVTAGYRMLRLVPKRKDDPVILMEVNPSTSMIHRFMLTYPGGDTNEFQFQNLKTAPLNPSIFEFIAPSGVEVIKKK